MSKCVTVVLSVVGVAFLAVLALIMFAFIDRKVRYQTFHLSEGRRVVISHNTINDLAFAFFYRVIDDGREAVPTFFIDAQSTVPSSACYRLVSDGLSNFVAIVRIDAPEIVLAMHDFIKDETWPYPGGRNYDHGREMLGQLRVATGRTNLFLTGTEEANVWQRSKGSNKVTGPNAGGPQTKKETHE